MRRLIMSRLIKIYTVCKSTFWSAGLKELKQMRKPLLLYMQRADPLLAHLTRHMDKKTLLFSGLCFFKCVKSPVEAQTWVLPRNCLQFPQVPYYMYMTANSKGSGKTALMRRLIWAFAGRLCGKYSFPMCWRIYTVQSGPLLFLIKGFVKEEYWMIILT